MKTITVPRVHDDIWIKNVFILEEGESRINVRYVRKLKGNYDDFSWMTFEKTGLNQNETILKL